MKSVLNADLIYEVLSVVEEIPEGRVATYGQIARLTGRDRNARLVGKILSMSEYYGQYPCHRVVNHTGRTAPRFTAQRKLLLAEGIEFKPNGCVDLKRFQWDC
ncbi:MAG: MGMT family protein [Clostridiales bacterium]|nr:MGMT family protein [Clostridiales bacterium]